uniref:Platelet endothelial aggregation receptor 1-like isoform X2 n=1 Tax=Crassostrea virginica TaxID=6565 RepID=A0A8B8C346_CRAVI|nr:platelet endothelial aggregation receptor 1-like isoform X2 [Crassostrea virginica]
MTGMVLLVCCGWTVLLCLSVQAYENLAFYKPAWQSDTAVSYTGAERAVDGEYTDLGVYGGQCAVSYGGQTAEWRVDLGGVKYIHHVLIQYATGNKVWDENNPFTSYFLGLSVYISNTTNKEDGVLCFRDTNYTKATIPNPVNITCPYHGRYVIYYNNRTHPPYPEGYGDDAWNVLCEVEVYGCPSPGYYGENCSLECPQNCQDGYCDIVNGTCFGCAYRYIGPRCQDCPEGLFGRNCSQNCSMTCGDPGRCDIMTGHCNGGCQVGWTGAKCEKAFCCLVNIELT